MSTNQASDWTREDSNSALIQGWDVFLSAGRHTIQRHDEAELFDGDESAIRHVERGAAAGYSLCIKALRLHTARMNGEG